MTGAKERRAVLKQAAEGTLRLLYLTPEMAPEQGGENRPAQDCRSLLSLLTKHIAWSNRAPVSESNIW